MNAKKDPSALLAGVLLLPVCVVALVEATTPAKGPWFSVYQYVFVFVYFLRYPMLVLSVGLAARGIFHNRSTLPHVVYVLLVAATIAVNLYLNTKLRF